MDKTKWEELEKAYKKEKNPRVAARMLAVHMVHVREKSVSETAADLMRTDKWVYDWLKRFDAGGLDGIRDLPKNGRPASVPRTTIDRIIDKASQGRCMPRELQELVRTETNIILHITSIRRIMRGYGLTPKIPQKVHISRVGKEAVRGWQYRFDKRVSRLEGDGFTIVDEDKAFFIHDVISGRKYWSPRGERIVVPYTGSHRRIVVYVVIAKDGRQFRTRESFDAPTFVGYLKEMQRNFGKMAVVMDRAFPHRAKLVRRLLRENKTSGSYTFQRDPSTSTRLRDAGARESRSCSSQNTIGRLLTCTMPSSRIIEPRDSSWTYSNLPTETRRYTARTFNRRYSDLSPRNGDQDRDCHVQQASRHGDGIGVVRGGKIRACSSSENYPTDYFKHNVYILVNTTNS